MKKCFLSFVLVLLCLCCAPQAFALFQNGGFETGNFTGWTVTPGTNPGDGKPISWGSYTDTWGETYDVPTNSVVSGNYKDPYSSTAVTPYVDKYMAKINDGGGMYHATKLSQAGTVTQQDIDDGGTLYVDWGVVLDDPNHDAPNQPFFAISVLKNGTSVKYFTANASAHSTDTSWTDFGLNTYGYDDTNWYKSDVWSFDILSEFILGDAITIELMVADCGYGGHGGYAFLDGIGTTYHPFENTTSTPEPGTMLLLGIGLVGLSGAVRRKIKK